MSFLPKEYKTPSAGGGYMKFQKGENKFRILSSAIVGMEAWTEEDGKKKSLRFKIGESVPQEFKSELKHFWAFVVWNYESESLQILEITQKSIQAGIKSLVDDSDWGNPNKYDLNITKEGEGMETRYSVMPRPAKAIDKEIAAAYKESNINVEALFDGGDPFSDISIKDMKMEEPEEEKDDMGEVPPF